jgi:hypothetical protein
MHHAKHRTGISETWEANGRGRGNRVGVLRVPVAIPLESLGSTWGWFYRSRPIQAK